MPARTIIALCGFRCSGKSHSRSILSGMLALPIFDTNSVPTGDSDSDSISVIEGINRYGRGESYFHFLAKHMEEHLKSANDILVIDSMKARADRPVLESYFPRVQIYLLWIHAPFKTRSARYYDRDIITEHRQEDLINHDHNLIELSLLDLCIDADFVVSNVFSQQNLESDLKYIVNSLHQRL